MLILRRYSAFLSVNIRYMRTERLADSMFASLCIVAFVTSLVCDDSAIKHKKYIVSTVHSLALKLCTVRKPALHETQLCFFSINA